MITAVLTCCASVEIGFDALWSDAHDGVGLLPLRSVVSIPAAHAVLTRNDVAFADELRTFERADRAQRPAERSAPRSTPQAVATLLRPSALSAAGP